MKFECLKLSEQMLLLRVFTIIPIKIFFFQSTVTSKAFSIIYDWMICESNQSCQLLRRDNILEIFMAAQFLGIKGLQILN